MKMAQKNIRDLKEVFVDPAGKRALLYLLSIHCVFFLLQWDSLNEPRFIVSAIIYLVYTPCAIAVLAYARSPRNIASAWGYIWRIYLVGIIGSVFAVLLLLWVFRIKAADFNFAIFVGTCLLNVLVYTLLIWVLFSSDRKGQFNALLKRFGAG